MRFLAKPKQKSKIRKLFIVKEEHKEDEEEPSIKSMLRDLSNETDKIAFVDKAHKVLNAIKHSKGVLDKLQYLKAYIKITEKEGCGLLFDELVEEIVDDIERGLRELV